MKWNIKDIVLVSTLLNLLFFSVFLFCFKPIVNSDDNFYVLYTLGGGYGNAPSYLLHYHLEWHPLLFWPIAKLFIFFPNFNWYTLLLLVLQFVSGVYLLYILCLHFVHMRQAVFFYFVFFLAFSSKFLFSLNHSNTSFILAISACTALLFYFINYRMSCNVNRRALIFPFVLLWVALLLRVHTTGLYVVITVISAFILLPLQVFKRFVSALFIWGAICLLFIIGQRLYHETHIPNYSSEEAFRQSLFQLANHPVKSGAANDGIANVKNSFIQSWFLYDAEFVSTSDIKAYFKKNVYSRISNSEELFLILYWAFINSRVYLFLFALTFFYFIAAGAYKELKKWLFLLLPGLTIYLFLMNFMKVTEGIFIAILASYFLSAIICLKNRKQGASKFRFLFGFFLALNIIWTIVQLVKTHDSNVSNIQKTRSILKEINAYENLLFINTNHFDGNGFYIWDTPSEYPLHNFINTELLITNSYQSTLDRFNVKQLMQELPRREDIVVSGDNLPLLEQYYLYKGLRVVIDKKKGFKYNYVFDVKIKEK